jgi:hypothetical protein
MIISCLTAVGRKDGDTAVAQRSRRLHSDSTIRLAATTIKSSKEKQKQLIESAQMGKADIPAAMLLKVPAIAGEADIVKALQLTPGVKRGTEGSIGMYVRGGGNDENLILLDGAPIYNAGHLLGFFSVFNNATIRDVQLYKSSFPAQYGGRLSSVLDVRTKEASLSDYHAQIGLGTISSSASVQLPLMKERLSLMLVGRRTYIDQVMKTIPYHFYDLNGKLFFLLDKQNRFYVSSYAGDDILKTNNLDNENTVEQNNIQTGMIMGNRTLSLRWNHLNKDSKISSDVSVFSTGFKYEIEGKSPTNQLSVNSAINDIGFKADIRSTSIAHHKLTSGFAYTHHYFNPNVITSSGPQVGVFGNSDGKKIKSDEVAVYVNDELTINKTWLLSAGLRTSGISVTNKVYLNAEPRLGIRYLINERNSLKVSYAKMTQYLHLVSNSSIVLPTDMWYPVTANVKPGISDQASAGFYHTIPALDLSFSTEVYYKRMRHLLEYREGAVPMMSTDYEKELVTGNGRSYGCELFINKTAGRFTGWMSYTLSFAHRKFDSLNNGKEYFARYDRRHDFSLVGLFDINKRWSIGTTVVYATGSPFTGQTDQYITPSPGLTGFEILFAYTGRNAMRMSPSFRTDGDLQYKFNIGKHLKADAHLSVYNVFNRSQPSRVERVWDDATGRYKYQQKGLFGTITALSLNLTL